MSSSFCFFSVESKNGTVENEEEEEWEIHVEKIK
jgi:hypothetical protein